MRLGVVRLYPIVLASLAACGGDGPEEPNPNPPEAPIVPASLVILTGDGQADTAGATFATPITVEVRDSTGAPLPDVEVWFGEAAATGAFPDDRPRDTTDAAGKVEFTWRPGVSAGVHRLRAGVYLEDAAHVLHLIVADTIRGTVSPASPGRVNFTGPATRFLGQELDMATVVGQVWDRYSNPVTVTSVTAEASAPFVANGSVVHSDVEVDTVVNVVVNGVPFSYRLEARRDLRELVGGTGGYVCDKPPGAETGTPGLSILRRVASITVDSALFVPELDWTYLFYRTTWHDELSDGTEADGGEELYRVVNEQSPGRFSWNGPDMIQTSTDPLRYEAVTSFPECHAWDIEFGGPTLHQLLHLSK